MTTSCLGQKLVLQRSANVLAKKEYIQFAIKEPQTIVNHLFITESLSITIFVLWIFCV